MDNHEFCQLIQRTGVELVPQQSLECSPCIHTQAYQLANLDEQSIVRLEALEQVIGQSMYTKPIRQTVLSQPENLSSLDLQQFDRGCGAAWGCGE